MNSVTDLNANELARLDGVCLAFEKRLRSGKSPSIDRWVQQFGGSHQAWLAEELQAIAEELSVAPKTLAHSEGSHPPNTPARSLEATIADAGESRDGSFSMRSGDNATKRSLPDSSLSEDPPPNLEVETLEKKSIGPYKVVDRIGRGGMGIVYRAEDTRLDRVVAIKTLLPRLADRDSLRQRFLRETQTVAAIRHPNIVEIHDCGTHEGLPYAVMEYLSGPPLDEVLADEGKLPVEEVISIGLQMAEALDAAHSHGIVHRDLKPQNLLWAEEGREGGIKVLDFGLSRRMQSWASDKPIDDQTRQGQILGTPGYMSPEQASGIGATASSDLFGLGCILHECLYGERAFEGSTYQERITATLHKHPESDSSIRKLNQPLASVIEQCLGKTPESRPKSAREVADRLQRIAQRDSVRTLRRRSVLVAALGGMAVVGSLGYGKWVSSTITPWPMQQAQSIAVLSFISDDDAPKGDPTDPSVSSPQQLEALGNRPLTVGEDFAGMVTRELSRNRDLRVTAFRPVRASTPSEFQELGRLLEVPLLLTGRIKRLPTDSPPAKYKIDLELVDARDGKLKHQDEVEVDNPHDPTEQREVAQRIATLIGHQLSEDPSEETDNGTALHCFVDGKVRADLDSQAGLEKSLMCLQLSQGGDQEFIQPAASLALTAMSLAAGRDGLEAIELIDEANQAIEKVEESGYSLVDGRLAKAMIDWQSLGRFEEAYKELDELKMTHPNHWQVRHQLGLLLSAAGRHSDATEQLRQASRLHPLSGRLRVDLARAKWFSGDVEGAIIDAEYWLGEICPLAAESGEEGEADEHTICRPRTWEVAKVIRGLLVDIHEHLGEWEKALKYDQSLRKVLVQPQDIVADQTEYWGYRIKRLSELPYAPFGETINSMIQQVRSGSSIDEAQIAGFIERSSPMGTYFLAAHPAMKKWRSHPRVAEELSGIERLA